MSWEPPEDATPYIVCAACRHGEFIAAGPRHFDDVMRVQVEAYLEAKGLPEETWADFDQGFVDQYGRYYSREDAMAAVKANGQSFDLERNGGHDGWLFSEGLY